MSEFLPKIKIKAKNAEAKSIYELDLEMNAQNLYHKNYILNKIEKKDFLMQNQECEYFLLYGNSAITVKVMVNAANNNKFAYPSMKVINSMQMQLIDWGLEEFGTPIYQR